jgi:hypothetical protein
LVWERISSINTTVGRTRPTLPEASAGRTIPLNVHGKIVYLDWNENALLVGLILFGSIGSALGGILLVASSRRG